MRFVHTADWHLGRVFHGAHLTDDQAFLLDELYRLLKDSKADCLLVSGDVYDRSVPPTEAVELLDDFLCRTTVDLGLKVILCAGNHDSPERLHFASRLLENRGLIIAGRLSPEPRHTVLEDDSGEVHFIPLPWFEPGIARNLFGDQGIGTHAEAMEAVLSRIRPTIPPGTRSVLLAHCFVEGGSGCESERPLSIGGAESIPAGVFGGFSYAALGHLHRPQSPAPGIVYPGSLMRYSFSETDHDKFFHVVDLEAGGGFTTEKIPIVPKRQIRKVRGLFDEVLKNGASDPSPDDYLHVELQDSLPVYEAMRRLREVYPNTLHIERSAVLQEAAVAEQADHRKTGPVELFSAFFRQTTGNELSVDQKTAFASVLDGMRTQEQEVAV